LHAGPLQLAALALLKVDALSEPAGGAGRLASERLKDISAIRKAVEECLNQIRDLSASLTPTEAQEGPRRADDGGDRFGAAGNDRRAPKTGTMFGYR